MRRLRGAVVALGVTAGLAAAAAAPAQEGGTTNLAFEPNRAGRPTNLVLDARPAPSPGGPGIRGTILALQRGFRIDLRARAARCTDRQARELTCPAASRIGTGFAVVNAKGAIVPGGSQDFTASLEFFLSRRDRPGDLAGVVVTVREPVSGTSGSARGRLVEHPRRRFTHELRFDRFPAGPEPPAGVTITLKRLHLRVGAGRSVRRNGRRVRFDLLRNPSRCSGIWRARTTLKLGDGTQRTTLLSAACRPRAST